MSHKLRKIPPKKSKTIKVLVPRSDNPRAQRLYLIIIGIMIWAATIRVLLVISQFYKLFIGGEYIIDPIVSALEISILSGFAVGLYGILKTKPPLHYFIHYAAVVNLIISYSAGVFGYLLGMASVLLIYIGLRFPIRFEWEKRRLVKEM
ncbi:MAG: hypothetical protein ACC656_04170 [Candidatus Heimdallarchaeota archaeon]